jgi:hypothetical protein
MLDLAGITRQITIGRKTHICEICIKKQLKCK